MTKQNKIKRISLIRQLCRLEDTHCEPCTVRLVPQGELDQVCKDCPIYTQIRAIGDELIALGSKVEPKPQKVKRKPRILLEDTITVEMYMDYKNKGFSNSEISRLIGFNRNSLGKWIRRNGIL